MSFYKTFLDSLATRLYYRLKNFNDVKLEPSSQVHSTVQLNGAVLRGVVHLDEGVKILGGVHIKGNIKIGRYSTLNGPNTDIYSLINGVTIGSFCSIARNVSIQEYDHNYKRLTSYYFNKNILGGKEESDVNSKGNISIGHDVWIGTQCVILSGATIGNGCVIAANSVVTGELPAYSIASGSPAKVIKYRFNPDIIQQLEKSRWWELPLPELKDYYHNFNATT
jgi:virginiamycin A acetyltransferase